MRRGWSTLGDVGYLDNEGFLYLTDRKSYMIISGGVNIYPQETEDVLITHPGVADVAVFGVPNEEMGEEVKAVVQPHDMARAGKDAGSRADVFCRKRCRRSNARAASTSRPNCRARHRQAGEAASARQVLAEDDGGETVDRRCRPRRTAGTRTHGAPRGHNRCDAQLHSGDVCGYGPGLALSLLARDDGGQPAVRRNQMNITSLPAVAAALSGSARAMSIGINGLRVHVLEAGFGTRGRPCLLLLHGFPELAF